MIRTSVLFLVILVLVWAPWMSVGRSEDITNQIFEAFGPIPSVCYDSDGEVLQDGLTVRWYPLGRMVHTCAGDFVLWMWGGVQEIGGLYKSADDIQAVQSRPLTCTEVLERQEARLATTTDSKIVLYEGIPASEPDFSIFEEASEQKTIIGKALHAGPTFAGTFAVAEWACGTGCKKHAVINVETGLVVAYGPQTEYGIEYALNSTILITNPVSKLPELPITSYETEGVALSIARLAREYYRLTTDALSGTQYLVRQCVESSATGYIEIEDDRLGVIVNEEE